MNSKIMLSLSSDVLRALYAVRDRRVTLDDLCDAVGACGVPACDGVRVRAPRREDVREVVRRLDEEGFVDAMRMRLTMQGFTLAASLTARRLVPLHLVA
jgi:hypothetical protein